MCTGRRDRHTACVRRRPGWNRLDGRRRLAPRDYLTPPEAFGQVGARPAALPEGGDEVSAAVARVQHRLAVAWHLTRDRPSVRQLGDRYGVSKQVFSRSLLGQRWMGETVMAALLDGLSRPGDSGSPPAR